MKTLFITLFVIFSMTSTFAKTKREYRLELIEKILATQKQEYALAYIGTFGTYDGYDLRGNEAQLGCEAYSIFEKFGSCSIVLKRDCGLIMGCPSSRVLKFVLNLGMESNTRLVAKRSGNVFTMKLDRDKTAQGYDGKGRYQQMDVEMNATGSIMNIVISEPGLWGGPSRSFVYPHK